MKITFHNCLPAGESAIAVFIDGEKATDEQLDRLTYLLNYLTLAEALGLSMVTAPVPPPDGTRNPPADPQPPHRPHGGI